MCNINIFLTQKHEKQSIGYRSYGSYICECTLLATFIQITPYHKYNKHKYNNVCFIWCHKCFVW
jgi:hypothetical protein